MIAITASPTGLERATPGSAGYDLVAAESLSLAPGARARVATGWRVIIPDGYVGMVCSRSGLAFLHGVFVRNAPGIIDADYRGEAGGFLQNAGTAPFLIHPGDRVAQLLILQLAECHWNGVPTVDPTTTARGAGGFGSTGGLGTPPQASLPS